MPRPPSRVDAQVSPSERPSPDHVYNVSNAKDAQNAMAMARRQIASRGPLSTAGANVGARPARASSSGPSAGRAPRQGSVEVTRTPVFAYLKVQQGVFLWFQMVSVCFLSCQIFQIISSRFFESALPNEVYGLNQYARAFAAAGLGELDAISKLSETEALDFLEHLRIYPGHKLRLLRAVECLRHASSEKRDAAQMLEDDAALQRLCSQKESLSKEKAEAENESKRCQEENRRLLELVREQSAQLQKERDRVMELEDLVRGQTEQVQFLASQLHALVQAGGQEKVTELFESFRRNGESKESQGDFILIEPAEHLAKVPRARSNSDSALESPSSSPGTVGSYGALEGYGPRQPFVHDSVGQSARSKLAKSMEIPSNVEVDNLTKCLATALHNKIILSVGRPRPHNASIESLAACSIFLEPVCKEILERQGRERENAIPVGSDMASLGTPLSSLCSPLGSKASDLRDSQNPDRPCHPFNAIAIRRIPNKWDIYDFLELVIRCLEVHAEVSVVTLVYLERFCGMSGVAFTPDNWQRLTITAMMLASKVWYDESYENIDFAERFDLYTLNEINTFERIFLKCVSYDMSVKTVQYAETYFFLRTLGAKDSPEFTLQPLDDLGALRLQERCLAKQIEFKKRYTGDDDFSVTTAF